MATSIASFMQRMRELGAPPEAIEFAVEQMMAERTRAVEIEAVARAERDALVALRRADAGRKADRRAECSDDAWALLRDAVIARDQGTCVYCRSTDGPFAADHVVPFSRGGRSIMENLVCACRRCNSSKGGRTLSEWRRA